MQQPWPLPSSRLMRHAVWLWVKTSVTNVKTAVKNVKTAVKTALTNAVTNVKMGATNAVVTIIVAGPLPAGR